METLVVKLKYPEKAKLLMDLLKSIDFVSNVEYFDKYVKGQKLLEAINKIASKSELATMTEAEIDAEIKAYRDGQ